MSRPDGRRYFAFFLHGHLPWVLSHGRWPHGAEWLCEATMETYLPLVRLGRALRHRGRRGGLTLGISPVLAEQLAHADFVELFRTYLEERVRSIRAEAERFDREDAPERAALARRGEATHLETRRFFFDELDADLLGAFRDLEESGALEIATCGATHGYFPLLGRDESIALQVELARRVHRRHFGRAPRGFWIPEAAYRPEGKWSFPGASRSSSHRPGIESFLADRGIRYFLVDANLLLGGRSVGSYPDVFRDQPEIREEALKGSPPVSSPPRPRNPRHSYWVAAGPGSRPAVRFFVRDPATALQVWSGEHGYPGDPAYLEFHKRSDGGGHRYWRVTGSRVDLGDKEEYDPGAARARVEAHASHFDDLVAGALADSAEGAILAAPFDAELFGHWWAEGVDWIERVLERFHSHARVTPTTFARHAEDVAPEEIVRLPEGSWGEGGGHWVWQNPQVDWIWKIVHPAEDEVWDLWRRVEAAGDAGARRIAAAAGRQLVLLSASDWPFLITTGTAIDYATDRIRRHADDLARLVEMGRRTLEGETLPRSDREFLERVEARDDLFPEIEDAMRAVAG